MCVGVYELNVVNFVFDVSGVCCLSLCCFGVFCLGVKRHIGVTVVKVYS